VAAKGAALPAAGEQSRGYVREEEEERGGGPGDLSEISRKFKGTLCKLKFLTDIGIKLYNIALGLKFKNSKFTAFYVNFSNKDGI
jgi:hypothetical protein